GLAEPFVIHEEKGFDLLERAADRCAKHIALKLRNITVIEEDSHVQETIAQKFIRAAMEPIRTGGGDDIYLRPGALAVFGSIVVFHHGEFSDSIDAQKLTARSSRRVV